MQGERADFFLKFGISALRANVAQRNQPDVRDNAVFYFKLLARPLPQAL